MSRLPLTTYLRTHRRKGGLSQDEVAFLLGTLSGTSVSRHESGKRQPILETGLAYELIFGVPVGELYRGIYRKVGSRIAVRVRRLSETISHQRPSPMRDRKILFLKEIRERLGLGAGYDA